MRTRKWRRRLLLSTAPVLAVHLTVGILVITANLVAGVWGATAWYQRKPSVGFWYALRVAQVAVVIQVGLGGVLVLEGREAPDGLHYLYGVLPIMIALLAEGARTAASEHELEGLDFDSLPPDRQRAVAMAISRRETGIMAVSALVILGLALRAAFTSPI